MRGRFGVGVGVGVGDDPRPKNVGAPVQAPVPALCPDNVRAPARCNPLRP